MRKLILMTLCSLIILGCEDENLPTSDDKSYISSPILQIESPQSGDTVSIVFPVRISFPNDVAVDWAQIIDTRTKRIISLYDQFYNPLHAGEMTLLVSEAPLGEFTRFYSKVFLTNGDSVTSPVVVVSNTKPNVDWPQQFCEIISPSNGDTVYNDFTVTVRFYSDTLPVKAARVKTAPEKQGAYYPSIPLEIQVHNNWWLTDCDSCPITAELILLHDEILPKSDPVYVYFIK